MHHIIIDFGSLHDNSFTLVSLGPTNGPHYEPSKQLYRLLTNYI